MASVRKVKCKGYTIVEITAVTAVIVLLMAMGFMLYSSMRLAARVSVAENNLKQVATGMELYFREHHSYPPQGSDLAEELGPFVDDPAVFSNPLTDEETPGESISEHYREPDLDEIDSPGNYVTAMPSDNGTTIVVLETGSKVVRRDDIVFDPEGPPEDLLAQLDPDEEEPPGDGGDAPPDDPPPPPEDPENSASPNDYTEEMPDGVVTPKDCFDATFAVRSVNLTWGANGPNVPVTLSAQLLAAEQGDGSTGRDLFGGNAVASGATDTFTLRNGQSYTLTAQAAHESWSVSYSSDGDLQQVLTLRNGDLPSQFDPFQDPIALGAALEGVIDPATGEVTIADNQVLYLFELGSTDQDSEQFDLQDLVVVVTLDEPADPAECEAPAEEEDDGFDVEDDGEVEVKICSDVTIKCIGSQFGYADGTLVPIAAAAKMGEGWFDLFGGQPVQGGETFHRASVDAGTKVVLRGEIVGQYERWLYTQYGYPLSYTSTDGTGQVLVFKRGDAPPSFQPGFPCQASAGDLVAPYIDPQTGVVTIAENEAIYLWDFNPLHTNYGIDYQDLLILATAVAAEYECEGDTEDDGGEGDDPPQTDPHPVLALSMVENSSDGGGVQVAGRVNLNPSNNDDFEFRLEKPDGSVITRDDLLASRGDLDYTGTATLIRFRPKGNGNQNALTIDGVSYRLRNGTLYTLTAPTMTVHVYNDHNAGNGAAMGRWWLEVVSAANATLEGYGDNGGSAPDQETFTLRIRNTAQDAVDFAKNVSVGAEVLEGAAFVDRVRFGCPQNLGNIPAGASKDVPVEIETEDSWSSAYGQRIRVQLKITNEENDPDTNVGKNVIVTIEGPTPPQPVLSIAPGSKRTKCKQFKFAFHNTVSGNNPAANVRICVTVLAGSQYLNCVQYDGNIGSIGAGACKYRTIKARVKYQAWRRASSGAEIRLLVKVTQETNNPDANVGKAATYTVYK